METKFLSDGHKVVVVGALNNQEAIVQEVFVTQQGDEIPGGERFVVRSLHDQPVETWSSREKVEQEKALADARLKTEKVDNEISNLQNALSFWKEMVKQVKAFSDHINEADLEHFAGVMTGQVKFTIRRDYSVPSIERFEDFMSSIDNYYGRKNFGGIKCLSLLGNTNGDIALRVNRYPDGSGGSDTAGFCKTIEEARQCTKRIALDRLNGNGLSIDDVRKCCKMGIVFNKDGLQKTKDRLFSVSEKNLAHYQENFDKQVAQINDSKQATEKMLNGATS